MSNGRRLAKPLHRAYLRGFSGTPYSLLLRLKEQPEYSEIELMIALPFAGHDSTWDDRSRLRMAFLIKHSAKTVTVGASDQPPAVNAAGTNFW